MFLKRCKIYRLLIYLLLFEAHSVEGPSGKEDSSQGKAESSSGGIFFHPKNPFLKPHQYAELGQRRFGQRKFYEALRCYDKAIDKKPTEAEYYRLRGDCLLSMGQIDKAISDFRKAVEEDPQNKARRVFLISVLFDHRKFDEAIDETYLLNDVQEIANLGNKLCAKKKFESALGCYDDAMRRNSSEASYHELRGLCYLEMRDVDKAISDFKEALSLRPNLKDVRARLCEVLFNAERFDEAIQATLLAGALELVKLGDKFLNKNKYNEAIRCFTAAINENPDKEPTYYRRRGLCHQRMQNLEEAISDYKKVVQMVPASINRRIELCELLLDAERFDEATEALENLNEDNMWADDIARVKKMRQKIQELEEAKKRARLEALQAYSERLITVDMGRKIDQIKEEIFFKGPDETLQEKVRELGVTRDDYLQDLAVAFIKYQQGEVTPEPVTRPTDEDEDDELDVPDYLLDKITFEIMTDPVTTPSGVTYDRSSIMSHLRNRRTDPMTRLPLEENQLIPNRNVRAALEQWNQEHTRTNAAGPSGS